MAIFIKIAAVLLCLASRSYSQVIIPGLAIFPNVSYGSDPQQVMDIYLPGGRDATVSKVIVLIHGGGWSAGRKEDFNGYVYWFYITFPRYAIVNMGYRLGTVENPGFPKQLQDIALVLQYITAKQTDYQIRPEFALVGGSAGAHLAMLYGYAWDKGLQVNVICNIVGPTDLTDPAYQDIPIMVEIIKALVGNYTLENNSTIYVQASPVYYITRQSPKTISFFGGVDPLIPVSQGKRLQDRLNAAGVKSQYHMYPDEGHGFVNPNNTADFFNQLTWFFKNNL